MRSKGGMDLTVAAVVERQGQFLMVEERIRGALVLNQPAGHVEANESLIQAVIRETLEESAWRLTPADLLGLYLWRKPHSSRSYLRIAFTGTIDAHDPHRRLDRGIVRSLWMAREDMLMRASELRSPLVLRCVDDYVRGQRYPLAAISDLTGDGDASCILQGERLAAAAGNLLRTVN
ncbi:MAG: NUDIX hydrolase [Steroidobacteraceae bacterium]